MAGITGTRLDLNDWATGQPWRDEGDWTLDITATERDALVAAITQHLDAEKHGGVRKRQISGQCLAALVPKLAVCGPLPNLLTEFAQCKDLRTRLTTVRSALGSLQLERHWLTKPIGDVVSTESVFWTPRCLGTSRSTQARSPP